MGFRCDVFLALSPAAPEGLLHLLDEAEEGRRAKYVLPADRARFVTGRAIAKALVGRELGVDPAAVRFDSACVTCGKPHGKPRVPAAAVPGGAPAPELSISHSGDRVAVALTRGAPVGVDVEEVIERERMAGLLDLTLSARERAEVDGLAPVELVPAFFTYWARKEAVLKATADGLMVPMRGVTVSGPGEPAALLDPGAAEVDPADVLMSDFDAGEGYRASVAVIGAGPAEPDWLTVHDAVPLLAELA